MKTKSYMYGLLLLILVCGLLLTGCSSTHEEKQPLSTTNTSMAKPVIKQTTANIATDNVASQVVPIQLLVQGNTFAPTTVSVNKGDTVQFVIGAGQSPYTFSVPAFGIEQYVRAGSVVEFVADSVGTTEFYCLDCSPKVSGHLVVN